MKATTLGTAHTHTQALLNNKNGLKVTKAVALFVIEYKIKQRLVLG